MIGNDKFRMCHSAISKKHRIGILVISKWQTWSDFTTNQNLNGCYGTIKRIFCIQRHAKMCNIFLMEVQMSYTYQVIKCYSNGSSSFYSSIYPRKMLWQRRNYIYMKLYFLFLLTEMLQPLWQAFGRREHYNFLCTFAVVSAQCKIDLAKASMGSIHFLRRGSL